jgi:hypothetical protein
MSIDAMKQALDYIKATNKSSSFWLTPASELNKTVTALRLAIEQAEKQEPVIGTKTWYEDGQVITQNLYPSDVYKQEKQEPVAWLDEEINCAYTPEELDGGTAEGLIPLYAAPPQRQPLTEEEIALMEIVKRQIIDEHIEEDDDD